MKIEIEISEENESTAEPYWLILDPNQNMRIDINILASQITGPFFSREEAEAELSSRRYAYGKKAKVYCMSGYNSRQYKRKIKEKTNE
jgi:hypothetical protein